jgi:hypothetical protein
MFRVASPRPPPEPDAQSVDLFLAAIAQGMPAAGAMEAFGTLSRGSFSHDDECFYPESASLGPITDSIGLLSTARRLVVSGCEGGGDTTIFMLAGAVAAVASDRALGASRSLGGRTSPPEGWSGGIAGLYCSPVGRGGQADHTAVPGHSPGRVGIGARRTGRSHSLDHARAAGHAPNIGVIAAEDTAQPSSWGNDEDAKRALGPVIAKWLASGVLGYVAWDDRMPILLQPCGAVPKGTAPFYRLITVLGIHGRPIR